MMLGVAVVTALLLAAVVTDRLFRVNLRTHVPSLVAAAWRLDRAAGGGGGSSGPVARSLTQQFTVRMNTFRRNDDLKKSVDKFSECPAVAQIQVRRVATIHE